jgi:hypothetical protein
MAKLGTITLQALDDSDVFLSQDIYSDEQGEISDALVGIVSPGLDIEKAYVSGAVPKSTPVFVEADAAVIYGWFRSEEFNDPFRIRIYLECEKVEGVEETNNTSDERGTDTAINPGEDPAIWI